MLKIEKSKLFLLVFILGLSFISLDIMAQSGPNLNGLSSALQGQTSGVKQILSIVMNIIVLIGGVFVAYAFITGNPQARTFLLGLGAAVLVWAVVNFMV